MTVLRTSTTMLARAAGVLLILVAPLAVADSDTSEIRVVYHMDDARSGRFALHIAEDQLKTNADMKIAVVAYAGGVDFLLKGARDKDGVPYEPAIQDLISKGVQFRACSATLGFRDIPKDKVVEGVDFVPAGTYEVIRLQAEEGYAYLKP